LSDVSGPGRDPFDCLMVLYFDGKLKKNILYVKTQEN